MSEPQRKTDGSVGMFERAYAVARAERQADDPVQAPEPPPEPPRTPPAPASSPALTEIERRAVARRVARRLGAARHALAHHRHDEARAAVDEALQLDPRNAEGLELAARLGPSLPSPSRDGAELPSAGTSAGSTTPPLDLAGDTEIASARAAPPRRAPRPQEAERYARRLRARTRLNAAEEALVEGLRALLPGSVAVGEEAVAGDPALLATLDGDAPVWIIDPIDGTHNFAVDNPRFTTLVALAHRGELLASWTYAPVLDVMATARAGAGAHVDGERVPPLTLEPAEHRPGGEPRLALDDAGQGQEDRREEDEEAPEDERVHETGDEPLQQLALTEHDRRLVADAGGEVRAAVDRLAREDEPREEECAPGEEPAGDRDRGGERDRGGDARLRAQPLLTLLSSAEMAGTTSCRSPMTA